jgi:cell shape-determining protein MreC
MFNKKRLSSFFYCLLALFLLLYFLNFLGAFKGLRFLAESTLVVPLKEKIYTWQRRFKKDLDGCGLINEKEVKELKARIAVLEEENLSQKRLLSSPLPKNWQFMTVKVIGSEGEELTISSGIRDGVSEGMIAVFGETYLGKVEKVSEKIAIVRLASFFEEKAVVNITSKDKEIFGKGLLVGKGEGKMKVEQILSSEKAEKGNLIFTSVEGGELFVGEVEEIFQNQGEVFKNVSVKRFYNPEELNTIFLVRGRL